MSTSSESRATAEAADRVGTASPDAHSAAADPDTVVPAATTTGIWFPTVRDRRAGYIATSPVREAAAAGFDLLDQQLPPVPLFKRLEREREEIMLEVKITKKSNPPAMIIFLN